MEHSSTLASVSCRFPSRVSNCIQAAAGPRAAQTWCLNIDRIAAGSFERWAKCSHLLNNGRQVRTVAPLSATSGIRVMSRLST